MSYSTLAALVQFSLKESTARTVNGAFENLLTNEINISPGIRSQASDSQNHLREFLETENQRDAAFPRILSIQDNDFLGGSFARHTKIWPLDDIDIFFPIDGHGLVYLEGGIVMPFTVVSDGVLSTNSILKPRWMNGSYISSAKVIAEFTAVLKRHYPDTSIKPDGHSVSVRMTQGQTDGGKGLGYDVVPCFSLKSNNGSDIFYFIPNGYDGWTRTNPRIDTELAEKLHAQNDKTYRKAIKVIKYWNKEKLRGCLMSYYIELAIAKHVMTCNLGGRYIKTVSEAVLVSSTASVMATPSGIAGEKRIS